MLDGMSNIFGWCEAGQHNTCRREYAKLYFDPRGGMVKTTDVVKCECRKRGCKCYTAPADRTKSKKRRRKS